MSLKKKWKEWKDSTITHKRKTLWLGLALLYFVLLTVSAFAEIGIIFIAIPTFIFALILDRYTYYSECDIIVLTAHDNNTPTAECTYFEVRVINSKTVIVSPEEEEDE